MWFSFVRAEIRYIKPQLPRFVSMCYNEPVVIPNPATEGGVHMQDAIISFLVAIMGGVACHYIIKWLDSDDNDN